jgi:hypothetical protein
MFQQVVMLILSAKSLLGLSAAYEIASAGRVVEAVTLGSVAVMPTVWKVARTAVAWPTVDELS